MKTYKITYTELRIHPVTGAKYEAWKGSDRVMAISAADARRKIVTYYANQGVEIVPTSCNDEDSTYNRRARRSERRHNYR